RIVHTLGTRDRLGSLLDEARIAQLVIGRASAPTVSPNDDVDVGDITLAPSDTGSEEREACARIEFRTAASPRYVPVTHLRARPTIPPGAIAPVVCTVRTVDGFVVARKTVALRLDLR